MKLVHKTKGSHPSVPDGHWSLHIASSHVIIQLQYSTVIYVKNSLAANTTDLRKK